MSGKSLKVLINIIGRSPLYIRRVIGWLISFFFYIIPNKNINNICKNLQQCFPEVSFLEKKRLEVLTIFSLGKKMVDSCAVWVQPREIARFWIVEENGRAILTESIKNRPTLILLPHIGNWELFRVWLSDISSATILYRPLRVDALSEAIKRAREVGGHKLVSTTTSGLRILFRDFRCGRTVIILPDQNPSPESGVVVPFFNLPALTSPLAWRLLKIQDANVVVAACVPVAKGYKVDIRPIDKRVFDSDVYVALKAINDNVESIVRDYPEHYQWEYDRFSLK